MPVEIRDELARLPQGRTPTRADWQRITRHWRSRLDEQIAALERLRGLARWGLGGRVGPGTQWTSWIHVEDWLAIVRETLTPRSTALSGVVHATGPHPPSPSISS